MTLFRLDASIRVDGSHSRALGDLVEQEWIAAHRDGRVLRDFRARRGPLLGRDPAVAHVEVVHREVHAVELTSGDRQVARHARADRQDDRVELGAQLVARDVDTDVDAAARYDAVRRLGIPVGIVELESIGSFTQALAVLIEGPLLQVDASAMGEHLLAARLPSGNALLWRFTKQQTAPRGAGLIDFAHF